MSISDVRLTGDTNVSELERYGSIAVGGLLVLNGVRKPSILTIAGAVAGGSLLWRGLSGHCSMYQAMEINTAAATDGQHIRDAAPEVESSITVGKGAEELYTLWREPETLAPIMAHFAEVTAVDGPKLTHWRLHSPLPISIEWDSELTVERPGKELSWASKPGTMLPNEGSVYFKPAPGGRGTEVRVRFRFQPPLGIAGDKLASAFSSIPKTIAATSLRHLKSLAETREIPTLLGNPSARGNTDLV